MNRILLLSASIFVVLSGIVVFSIFSKAQFKEPEVVVLGNPTKMDPNLRAKLPTGYSWGASFKDVTREELSVGEGDVTISPYSNVPWIVVSLTKDTDWEGILKLARDRNKETIYVLPNIVDPNIPVVSFNPSLEELLTGMENLFIPMALADTVPGISCSTGSTVPSGTCYTSFPEEDFPDDGLTPSVHICYKYATKTCHTTPMTTHMKQNIYSYGLHNHDDPVAVPNGFVKCLKAHNGQTFLKRPIDLTVNMYPSNTATGNAACGGNICGCGQIPQMTTPLESVGRIMWISSPCTIGWWVPARHEAAHTYGYTHCHMHQNLHSVGHCINGVQETGECNSVLQNLPPLHIVY